MKITRRALSVLLAALMLLLPVLSLASCGEKTDPTPEKGVSYVAIDINPTVEITLDKNEKVLTVYAANEDAEVMLYGSDGIVGEKLTAAVDRIAELAKEYGYVTEDNATVSVTVTADSEKTAEDIYTAVKTNMEAACRQLGVTVARCLDAVTAAKLNALKEQYPDDENIAAMTVEKYRLVRSVLLADRKLTVTEAAKMTESELTDRLTAKREERKAMLSRAMEMAVENAELIYAQTRANLVNTVYLKYGGTEAIRYGTLDNAYFTVSLMIKINGDLAEFGITEKAVRDVAASIGIPVESIDEFVSDCKDSEGYITDETISYAVNKWYRSMSAEARAKADEYMPELAEKLDTFSEQIKTLSTATVIAFNTAVAPLKLIADIDLDFSVKTYDDMADFADALRAAADESMTKIMNSLTDTQKSHLENDIKSVDEGLTEAENTLNAAIDKAKAEAERALKAAQESRKKA